MGVEVVAVIALGVAAGAGAFRFIVTHGLARALQRETGLARKGAVLTGTMRGHEVRIRCGKRTRIAVEPKQTDFGDLRFVPRLERGMLGQFDLGLSDRKIGDARIEKLYMFEGDPLEMTRFGTVEVRELLLRLRCSYNGRNVEAAIETEREERVSLLLRRTLDVADALGPRDGPKDEQLRRIALDDASVSVRTHALHLVMTKLPSQEVAIAALEDESPSVRCLAMFHLPTDRYEAPSEPELIELATSDGPVNGRRAAIHLLKRHGTLDAVVALNKERLDRTYRKDVEEAIEAIQVRLGAAEGRVSVVESGEAGALSESVDAGGLSITDD